MTIPQTTLDTRFSDPGTSPTSWADTVHVLTNAPLFWISTIRPDGRPHVTPLVAIWLNDALHFATGPDEQKGHNLHATPHVALTTGNNSWQSGLDVVVEGRVRRVTDRPTLELLATSWSTTWTAAGSTTSQTTVSATVDTPAPTSTPSLHARS